MGRVLRVNLSDRSVEQQELPESWAQEFIGGSGFGARILLEQCAAGTDPLSSENPLIFAVGPYTGTNVYNSDRFEVVSRSPLTGIYGESNCGGRWGSAFKRCGYDALVVNGQADSPCVLVLDGKSVRIEKAGSCWGQETFAADRTLHERYGQECQVALIGPAGERLVKFASIQTDGMHARAAGRCGLGAVMGSKRLKGIVVAGSAEIPVASAEKIRELNKRISPQMRVDGPAAMRAYGTSGGFEASEWLGNIPVKNWYEGPWEQGAKKLSGQRMADTILVNNYHCGRCAIGCGRTVKAAGSPYAGEDTGGPEYETFGLLGSNLLIDDMEAVARGNEMCNRLGLDTISTGGVIGFAMEAWERGLISEKDTGGIDLSWGNPQALFGLIEGIAARRGLGAVLAEGVREAAEQIGGSAAEFALHVKGLEPPAHDPRAKATVAIGYATSNRGACHLQAFSHDFEEGALIPDLGLPQLEDRFTVEGKAENVMRMQNLMSLFDSLTCCKFVLFGGMTVKPLTELLNAVTGWQWDEGQFMRTGERIFTLKRLYNVRLGVSRKDDTLPARMLTHRRGGGTDFLPPLNLMLNQYYALRDWDEFGIPKVAKLRELGLDGYFSMDVSTRMQGKAVR